MKVMSLVNKEEKKLNAADLLIIIINWNTKALLLRCLKSLQESQDAVRFDVVIVDNGSKDGSAEMVKAEFTRYYLLRNEGNLGFSKANNIAFCSFPQYPYYLLLNSDASVNADAIKVLFGFLKTNSDTAAVGPALKLPNGQYQSGGAGWGPSWLYAFNSFFLLANISRLFRGLFIYQEHYAKSQEPVTVDWLAGACLLVRATALKDIGMFDERYFVYGEDADWCWRARKKGWKIAYLPYVSVLHEFGASSTLKVSLSWFLNLVSAVKGRGGRTNYVLFLICGLIGYSIRLVTYKLQYALKKNRVFFEYKQQCGKLLNICYRLLFLPNSANLGTF